MMDGMTSSKSKVTEGMQTTEEVVTPLVAEGWLKQNLRNRTPNLGRVATIAADIAEGRWVVNGDAIRFGKDGTLYDGQHRLMAICKAGVAVRTNVVRGLEPEARNMIDMGGAHRTARDVVAITDGTKIPHAHVAWVSAAERVLSHGTLAGNRSRGTAAELRTGIRRHGASIAALMQVFGVANQRRILPASSIGMLLIAHRVYPAETLMFATRVKTGEALLAGDPCLVYRNHLINNRGAGGGAAAEDIALRTFSALEAFVNNESMKILKTNEGARDRFVAAWKAMDAKPASASPQKAATKPAGKLSVVPPPSAPGKFADAIRASQLRDTKKRTPDAPPPPVEVVPSKRSSVKTMAQIADVRAYLSDGKTHRTMEIAHACDIPQGSIFRVLTEALDVRNVSPGVWALKKAG